MKKLRYLSILLCLILVFQCFALPALADETTDGTETPSEEVGAFPEDQKPAFGTVSIQNGCHTINGMVPLGGTERKLNSAQGAFLFEMNTGTVVYSYNADVKLAPGNLAKIVTTLIALEMCNQDDIVTVSSRNISKLPAGSRNQYLKDEERLTVRDLLYCMMLDNANDAAIAIAEHIAGNQEAFVTLMNQRVKQIGCTSTEFENVHGLDNANSYTTARDMARITMEAIKNEEFVEIFKATKYTVPETNRSEERSFPTMNYMIDQNIIQDFYDARVTGGVTHAAPTSGASLICTAESNGLNYVAVVMGCLRINMEGSWRVKTYGNFEEMTELLRFGFGKFKANRILYEGMSLKQFPVAGGECAVVAQSNMDFDSVVPISASMDNLNIRYYLDKGTISAPVAKNQRIGTLEIWYRNSCLAEAEMFAMGDVKPAGDTGVTIRSTAVRRDSDDSGILSVIGTICAIVLGLAVAYLAFNAYMRSRVRARRRRRREARRRNY